MQEGGQLEALLQALKHEQTVLAQREGHAVPLALKIAPDLDAEQIGEIARIVLTHGIEAVIATNTTVSRAGLEQEPLANEPGGLSGRPLKTKSTEVIRELYRHLQGRVAIIGVGGIENADDAWEKLVAGADAVQVYTAFIYQGPALLRASAAGWKKASRGRCRHARRGRSPPPAPVRQRLSDQRADALDVVERHAQVDRQR